MPPRTYISPVSDDAIIAVFDPTAQLKATTVLRLLGLRRSRQRIIGAQLRRLSCPPQQRLVEVSPPAIAVYRNPFYSLAASSTAATPPPAPALLINGNSKDDCKADITGDSESRRRLVLHSHAATMTADRSNRRAACLSPPPTSTTTVMTW